MQFRHYKLLLDSFIDDIKNDKQPKNKKILVKDKIYCYFDGDNKFAEIFDNTNGFYICSDILDDNFNWTGKDPDERNAPALLDVGIMGHCSSTFVKLDEKVFTNYLSSGMSETALKIYNTLASSDKEYTEKDLLKICNEYADAQSLYKEIITFLMKE